MSYRVEVSTIFFPAYGQSGPTWPTFEEAALHFDRVLHELRPSLLGVRLRDLSPNSVKYDQIIMAVERPGGTT